jgi:predicted acetyltransferase
MSKSVETPSIEFVKLSANVLGDLPTLWSHYIQDLQSLTGRTADSDGYRTYLEGTTRQALQIVSSGVPVGFILINTECHFAHNEKNVAEFYVNADFRRQGVGRLAVLQLWADYPCRWEIAVLPKNIPGLNFWQQIIRKEYGIDFLESVEHVDFDSTDPQRWIFQINSKAPEAVGATV